ncbi:MAG: hypothetical protein HC933_09335 [Pleurocapsa sp. SU_196_0]|nr:hypothetical protein [Pleurocapsa sp. SU_196_0]
MAVVVHVASIHDRDDVKLLLERCKGVFPRLELTRVCGEVTRVGQGGVGRGDAGRLPVVAAMAAGHA